MTAGWALVLLSWLLVAAFVLGMWIAERTDRQMWRNHGYCPTCDRLTTEQESSC